MNNFIFNYILSCFPIEYIYWLSMLNKQTKARFQKYWKRIRYCEFRKLLIILTLHRGMYKLENETCPLLKYENNEFVNNFDKYNLYFTYRLFHMHSVIPTNCSVYFRSPKGMFFCMSTYQGNFIRTLFHFGKWKLLKMIFQSESYYLRKCSMFFNASMNFGNSKFREFILQNLIESGNSLLDLIPMYLKPRSLSAFLDCKNKDKILNFGISMNSILRRSIKTGDIAYFTKILNEFNFHLDELYIALFFAITYFRTEITKLIIQKIETKDLTIFLEIKYKHRLKKYHFQCLYKLGFHFGFQDLFLLSIWYKKSLVTFLLDTYFSDLVNLDKVIEYTKEIDVSQMKRYKLKNHSLVLYLAYENYDLQETTIVIHRK